MRVSFSPGIVWKSLWVINNCMYLELDNIDANTNHSDQEVNKNTAVNVQGQTKWNE